MRRLRPHLSLLGLAVLLASPLRAQTDSTVAEPALPAVPAAVAAVPESAIATPPSEVPGSESTSEPPSVEPSLPADVAVPSTGTDSAAPASPAPPPVRVPTRRPPMGPMGAPRVQDPGPVARDTVPQDLEIDVVDRRLTSDPRATTLYRSPRKAFFLSLAVPGAGQVYTRSWVRAALFAGAEIGLGVGWYNTAIVKARRKRAEARRWADTHWSFQRYEAARDSFYAQKPDASTSIFTDRSSYCDALYGSSDDSKLKAGCEDIASDTGTSHGEHLALFAVDGSWTREQNADFRDRTVKNTSDFYSLLATGDEFTLGWDDATGFSADSLIQWFTNLTDGDPNTLTSSTPYGTSAARDHYLALRRRADELARTQKWFLGGLVLNHLASAIDAALTASYMNRKLYKLESSWLDGLQVRGGLAWLSGPAPQAVVGWTF